MKRRNVYAIGGVAALAAALALGLPQGPEGPTPTGPEFSDGAGPMGRDNGRQWPEIGGTIPKYQGPEWAAEAAKRPESKESDRELVRETHFSAMSTSTVNLPPNAATAPEWVPVSGAYRAGERLVRLTDPMELPDLIDDYGVELAQSVGRSGFAMVKGDDAALSELVADPRVDAALFNGVIRGATSGSDLTEVEGQYQANQRVVQAAMEDMQWYINKVDPPRVQAPPSGYVVAVLDTGVAYETAVRDGVQYRLAPTLASSAIVAPYDFIHRDPHANDDHQHGTHIASIIAAQGANLQGVAPGVDLMPLKVLDRENRGHEFGLIEAIWHAVDHGADVINMSLSFAEGYQPSQALREALDAAAASGVVLVAASGNYGSDYVTWPAASPQVIAVGASKLVSGKGVWLGMDVADYSNASGAIDILAPGGDVYADTDGDGHPDGILAETIALNDPNDVGYWFMAGTSQAAAMVSGLAVELVRHGVPAHDIPARIQQKADMGSQLSVGRGAGFVDFDWEIPVHDAVHHRYLASMLPYLEDGGTTLTPKARVTVFEASGAPASDVLVVGSIWGNGDGTLVCRTNLSGVCTLQGEPVPAADTSGQPVSFAWSFAVEGVSSDGEIVHRPQAAMTTSSAFDSLVGALQAHASTQNTLLGWQWTTSADSDLGNVADAFSVVDTGSGLASIPFGIVITPRALRDLGSTSTHNVGIAQDEVSVTLLDLDGTGLTSLPLGVGVNLPHVRYSFVDGTRLASMPLGFKPVDPFGGGVDPTPLDQPVTVGSALGTQLADGGWSVAGYPGASLLGGSTALGIAPGPAVHADGASSAGAVPL